MTYPATCLPLPRMRHWLVLLGYFLFALILSGPLAPVAHGREWVERISMLEDPEGTLSFDQIRERTDWVPTADHLSLGFTKSVIWLRLDRLSDAPAGSMRLRIRPAYLDFIEVYAPAQGQSWSRQVYGDRFARGGNQWLDSAFSAPIDGRYHGPVFVRISTQSTLAVYLSLRDEEDSFRDVSIEHMVFGLYFGFMMFLALWAFSSAWVRREVAQAVFGLYLLALIGMGLGITGLASIFMPEGWTSDVWTIGFVLGSTLSGAVFHRVFLARFSPALWSLKVVDLCIAGAVLNILLLAWFEPRVSLSLNAWLVLIGCLAVSAAATVPGKKSVGEHRTLLVSYSLMLLVLGLTMLPVVGAGVSGSLAIHLTMGHGLIVAVTLSLALARLSRLALLEGQRLRVAQEQSSRELAIVSAQNQEYDRFLAMLTHELRNALSTAALVVRRVQRGLTGEVGGAIASAPAALPLSGRVDDPELLMSLERAASSLRAASSVIDKVQVARQVESGMSIEPKRALLSDRLSACVDRLAVTGLAIDIEPGMSLTQDWTYVDLIVSNLLENADRYRVPNSSIGVRARSLPDSPGVVELVIRNRCVAGADIDPERVFEKYWRDPHARSRRGAGLGLWLSRNAARAMGGDLLCHLDGPDIEFRLVMTER